jgi:RNA polymerase sigma-70 factor (ECF subfamily)
MGALLRKDPAAADALYARYASRIYGLGLVLLRSKTDAEDLVQDTFLKVWRKGSAFDPRRGSLDVWILLIARSLAIDLLRRRTLETRILSSEPGRLDVSDEPGPEWYAEQGDLIQRARKAMDLLPPGQRSAVELAYFGQRSSTQVAELQGVPLGTVKSRIREGVITLQYRAADLARLGEAGIGAAVFDACGVAGANWRVRAGRMSPSPPLGTRHPLSP